MLKNIANSACLIPLLIYPTMSEAQDSADAPSVTESVVVRFENDFFTGSDSNFTHGTSLTWSSDSLGKYEVKSSAREWADVFGVLPGFQPNGSNDYLILSVDHEINTPSDISLVNPPPDEQPYSGVLLFETTLYSEFENWSQAWIIRFGAVGPITQADHLQSGFHDLMDGTEPMGWSSQIPNEILLNVGYSLSKDIINASENYPVDWRIVAMSDVEFGNYDVSAGGNLFLELGDIDTRALNNSSIGSAMPSFIGIGSTPSNDLKVTGYLGVGAMAHAHFLPYDGTIFRESGSTDYNPVTTMLNVGATGRYKKVIVSFGLNFGNSPFKNNDQIIDYGSLSVGWLFD